MSLKIKAKIAVMEIEDLFTVHIEQPFKEFKRGVKSLWKWLPVIWKDRHWDDVYIYNILLHKLKLQRDWMKKNSIIEDKTLHDLLSKMDTVIAKLEKVSDEWTNYEEPAYDKHIAKWGYPDFYFEDSTDPSIEGVHLKSKRKDSLTEEQIEEMREEYTQLFTEACALFEKERIEAFALLGKHIPEFWD